MSRNPCLPALSLMLAALVPSGATWAQSTTERLDGLLPDLSSEDVGRVSRAYGELERLSFEVAAPGNERSRVALATAIAKKLTGEDSIGARLLLCAQLETIGKTKVVVPLSKILRDESQDPGLREAARRALEANPTSGAKKELRKAADSTTGPLRAAICRSIGVRKDLLALNQLTTAMRSEDAEVRLAAIEALSTIGDEQCVQPMEEALNEAPEEHLPRVRKAYLRLATELAANGDRGMARRLYTRARSFGPAYEAAAWIGLAEGALQSEIPKIIAALESPSRVVRGAAVQAAVIFDAPAMTTALVERAETARGELRARVVEVLGERGDPEALSALVAALGSDAPEVRLAAIGGLARFSSPEATRALAGLVAEGEGIGDAACRALGRQEGESVRSTLTEAAAGAEGPRKERLEAVLASRARRGV